MFFEKSAVLWTKGLSTKKVPKSLERIQAAVTWNIWNIPQILGGDRVSSL